MACPGFFSTGADLIFKWGGGQNKLMAPFNKFLSLGHNRQERGQNILIYIYKKNLVFCLSPMPPMRPFFHQGQRC